MVVDDPALVARMADMRDYGSAFMKGAPLAIVVLGDTTKSDLWRENAAISATILQLACVDEGLASCWVHIDGRPRRKDEPGGETAAGYLRSFLPIPADANPYAPSRRGIPTSPPPRCPSRTTRRGSSAWDKADTGTEKKERLRHSCITNTKSRIFRSRVEAGVYRKICRRSLYRPSYASGQYPHADQETEDCASGLMLLQQEDPDVVLCDVELLDGNGVDMVERIKEWLRW